VTEAGQAGRVLTVHAAAVEAAYRRSGGARWDVSAARFGEAVARSVAKRFGGAGGGKGIVEPARDAVEAFVAGLHAEDLALACACADGHGGAWDHFVLTYRPELYRAARAIAGESDARELADSLYAELYGLSNADGQRRSLLSYYHGRSRLGTWLRSVLAQRHVDAVRARRRLTSLDDPDQGTPEPVAPVAVEPDMAERLRVAAACVSTALADLDGPSRLRLAYYYVHGLTLAQAGRLFGEHEATASRKLEKARAALRTLIESSLAAHGMRAADVDSWADVATQAWDAALADALAVGAPVAGAAPPTAAATEEAQGTARLSFKGKRTP
jgi:RNA polymerase sigma factor (sigma-70 family)